MKLEEENFRMYYLLQFDRIDKLETKRENFCNYVLTITSVIFTVGFGLVKDIHFENIRVIMIFIAIINFVAILFIWKTRPWVKLHQKRAELVAKEVFPKILKIDEDAKDEYVEKYFSKKTAKQKKKLTEEFFDSDKDWFRRSRIYSILHILIIVISAFLFACGNPFKHEENKTSRCAKYQSCATATAKLIGKSE